MAVFMNLASLMWNIWKNSQNEGVQKNWAYYLYCGGMRFLNMRQVICKIASRWDLKSRDFSNLHFVGKMGQTIKYLKSRNYSSDQHKIGITEIR